MINYNVLNLFLCNQVSNNEADCVGKMSPSLTISPDFLSAGEVLTADVSSSSNIVMHGKLAKYIFVIRMPQQL